MAQVNTVHQMACFKQPDPTTGHPSWNCAANVLFTAVFASSGGHSQMFCSYGCGFWSKILTLHS